MVAATWYLYASVVYWSSLSHLSWIISLIAQRYWQLKLNIFMALMRGIGILGCNNVILSIVILSLVSYIGGNNRTSFINLLWTEVDLLLHFVKFPWFEVRTAWILKWASDFHAFQRACGAHLSLYKNHAPHEVGPI